ncbi:MAG: integrin alpha, partial [Thermoplasmata archaeon]
MRKIIVFLVVVLLLPASYIYFGSQGKQYTGAPMDYKTNVTKAENPRTMFLHDNTTGSPRLIVNDTMGDKPATYYESIRAGTSKTWEMYPPLNESRYVDNIYARLYLEPRLELEGYFGAVPDTRGLQHGILNFSGDAGTAKINGTSSSQAGFSVAVVDLNNDGYDDVVIGAPYNNSSDGSKPGCGAVFIFLGRPYFDIWNDTVNATVTIWGAAAGDHFGWSVANGSDLNGDGVYDLIVGAPDNSSSKGSVYVFFGNTTWDRNSTAQHFYEAWRDSNGTFVGESPGDKFGWSVAGIGNFNGTDRSGDFVVGAPYFDTMFRENVGRTYVFLGDNNISWSPLSPINAKDANATLDGESVTNELFGWTVAGAGDANSDGYNDVVIGAPGRNRAYLYYGSTNIGPPAPASYIHTSYDDFNAQTKYYVDILTGSEDPPDGGVRLQLLAGNGIKYLPNNVPNPDIDGYPDVYTNVNNGRANTQEQWSDGDKGNGDDVFWDFMEATPNLATPTMIVYGQYNLDPLKYSIWQGSAWGNELDDGGFGATIENVRAKPNPRRNEIVAASMVGDRSAPESIVVNVWSAGSWGIPLTVTTNTPYRSDCRQFDIAFETQSGDALIFYAGGSGNTLFYRIWNGNKWSAEQTFALSNLTGDIYWIEAASDPYTDEIAVLVADSNSDAEGIIWNGTNFWSEQLLTQTLSIATEQCHDVVYESISGYAMFVWGVGTNMNSRRWLNGTWEAPLTAVNIGGTCNWFSLKADPLSNRLVVVSVDDGSDLNTVRWSGSGWTLDTEHDDSVETNARRCADAIFESISGHEGHIILVYGDANVDIAKYRHFDGSTWGAITSMETTAHSTDPQVVQLRSDHNGVIFCGIVDDGRDLNTWTWDGSAWTWRKEHNTDLSAYTLPTEAFMISPSIQVDSTPYYDVEFQITGLTGDYNRSNGTWIVFNGYYYGDEAPIVQYRIGDRWVTDYGINIPSSESTVISTTNIRNAIVNGNLYIRLIIKGNGVSPASGVAVDWIGVKTTEYYYVPSGYIQQAQPMTTLDEIQWVVVTWSADGVTKKSDEELQIAQELDDGYGYYVDNNRWQAQSFKPPVSFILTKVSLNIWDAGADNAATIVICNDNNGIPNTASVIASATANFDASSDWYDVSFNNYP